jgi:hypothetical protein
MAAEGANGTGHSTSPTPKRLAEFVVGSLVIVFMVGTWLVEFGAGPANTAFAYANASMRGDANAAWPLVYVDRESLLSTNAEVLSEPALAATLTSRVAAVPAFQLQLKNNSDLRRSEADLTYSDSGATKQLVVPLISMNQPFRAHRQYFVDSQPGVISVGVPAGAGALSIDGIAVGVVPGGMRSIAVFPGHHRLSLASSTLFAAQRKETDVAPGKTLAFSFDGALTAKGQAAATSAIDSAIGACTAQTSSIPSGCPMSDIGVNTTAAVAWQPIGDPASWMSYYIDDKTGQFFAAGHYQLILTVTSDGTRVAEGGPFYVFLDPQGDTFKVSKMYASIAGGVAKAVPPPSATDQAIKDSLRPLFQTCAASTSYNPVNCPQYTTDFSAAWRLNGDPLADAKVTFDGDHSYFVVQGTCSFTEVGYYPKTAAGAYTAYVFWDGSKPVPVKIFGPLMAN